MHTHAHTLFPYKTFYYPDNIDIIFLLKKLKVFVGHVTESKSQNNLSLIIQSPK
jgi:hypothetical protein